MSLTIQVVPILDSRAFSDDIFINMEIYRGVIEGEVKAPGVAPCFLGSWYRKVVSSADKWLGIEGIVKLGEFTPDQNRFNLDGKGRFMDNPSVYMGGNSCKESDAGLGLNLSYLSSDTTEELNLASPKLAYRPFWRYIYNDASDINNNVIRREINSWNIANPRSLEYYYFPGDIVRMSVYCPYNDYLQLRIEVIEPTKIEKYVNLRQNYHLKNNKPSNFYSPIFFSKGHGYSKAEFKRVNSIDQFGNEGFNAIKTEAKVSTSVWYETYLYRKIDEKIVKVPFNTIRQVSMICPNEKAISVKTLDGDIGSEEITIHPGKN
ncbi:MAG: hypothetical protein PHX62_01775 [Bacilli bacterium]|nr:hypothetical protein [Bacilli bacterium]